MHHAGVKVGLLAGDLGKQSFLERVILEAGLVDILVQAAGVAIPESLLEANPAYLETMLRIKVWSVFTLTQAVARSMAGRGRGDSWWSVPGLPGPPRPTPPATR